MVDFSSLLNVKAEDIKAPPMVVPGDVVLTVNSFKFVESGQKKTPGVEFDFNLNAYEVVLTGDGEVPEGIVGKTISDTFWISQDAAKAETSRFMLKEFLEKCGIRGEGMTLNEMLAEVAGTQVKAAIRPEPNDKNPERPFMRIKSYSPL
jgi:hypothetical protein